MNPLVIALIVAIFGVFLLIRKKNEQSIGTSTCIKDWIHP